MITFLDEIDLREDYYWGGGDIIAQIAWELTNNPNSCFSKDASAWYNSLYSELGNLSNCSYRLPDPELPEQEEVIQFLIDYGLNVALEILEGYLIQQFTGTNPSEFNDFINQLSQDVKKLL